ncbi:MAG: 3-dehydroquinate synthase [Nitrospiraceae bacterium]|nr:3-dehydroquinate synthase [Nitrospiraceae bacterium]
MKNKIKKVEHLKVKLGARSYEICIGSKIIASIGSKLKSFKLSSRIGLISNNTVNAIYGKTVLNSLKTAGFDVISVIIPDGEQYKNLKTMQGIYDRLLSHKLDRKSAIVALGGGVIGDITGFAASTYMRGVPYIQIPTTLLSQVDSSVGGKTGVNHKLGKNMIGTFYQPKLVWIDIDTLNTLPKRELFAGLAEVIKYGVIKNKELFRFLEDKKGKILNLDKNALSYIIKRSCELKADVVSKDERESGVRVILNYGHTIGHAIETATDYKQFLHGEAVAIGMHVEARLSHILGFFSEKAVSRLKNLIDSYGLKSEIPAGIDTRTLLSSMQLDKKTVGGKLKFILPEKIGKVKIYKGADNEIIKKALLS